MGKQLVLNVKDVIPFVPKGAEGKYASRLLIDGESVGSKHLTVNHFTLSVGQKTYPGKHPFPYEEVYYILHGKAILTLGRKEYELVPDAIVYIPCEMEHQIENVGKEDLEMITIMPYHPTPGVNMIYDERKRNWGTSFKLRNKREG